MCVESITAQKISKSETVSIHLNNEMKFNINKYEYLNLGTRYTVCGINIGRIE